MPAPSPDRSLLADLALGRSGLDRSAHRRGDADWLAAARRDPRTRVLLVADGLTPVRYDDGRPRLALQHPGAVDLGAAETHLLGVDADGLAYLLARVPGLEPASSPVGTAGADPWLGLREIGADLSDRDAGLLVTAVALANWHDTHRHCARCGAATGIDQAGWVRRCTEDGSEHYPRTDPAVIALVVDGDDRALLGRQARWPQGWFSTLAGFVEPGETAEAAVRREVAEEAGLPVGEVWYLGSQPWPFPSSLMLGYHARALDAEVRVDGEEIAEARWFTREGLLAACASGEVRVPPSVSIARRLIERWYGGPLPHDWARA